MTRFVYVLPAGRRRWEVRLEATATRSKAPVPRYAPLREDESITAEEVREAVLLWAGRFIPGDAWDTEDVRDLEAALGGTVENLYYIEPQFYRRKSHALIAARAIAIIIGGKVQPHDRRGRIQDPDSFGGDSPRRRG